jgi:glycerol-3-phosphate acyltransferase PlsY
MDQLTSFELGLPMAALFAVIGYGLGSIPFGLILTRLAGLGDVRQIGSGNIGATNVLRTGNKPLAAATLLLDALKGTVAAWLGLHFGGMDGALVGGFAAFLGHLFPVWLSFRGGKGVATYIGVMLGISPLLALVFAVIWFATFIFSRYSSLSALVATLAVPVVEWFIGDQRLAIVAAVMTLIAWIKHKTNIERLLNGTEGRIGKKG